MPAIYCPNCGVTIPEWKSPCAVCGAELLDIALESANRNPIAEMPTEPPVIVSANSGLSGQPTEAAPTFGRLAEFQRTVAELTPRVYVTPVLIGANVILFVLMTAFGVNLIDPAIPDLLRWGADFGPLTAGGEWWRLFSCMFVHIGVMHILLNMWVLATAGPLVERMVGNVGFLLLYLVAGLCGSLASLLWNPMLVSAGASGAIFGIYGALLGMLLRHHSSIPAQALNQLRSSGMGFLVYNLLYGMMQANVDSAAHIGGLVGGFLCGIVLSQPFTRAALAGRPVRNLLASGLGFLLFIGGMIIVPTSLPDIAKVQVELQRFVTVDKETLSTVNDGAAKYQRRQLTDSSFADFLERDVLPVWKGQEERLSVFQKIPPDLQRYVSSVLEYMHLREEGWQILVEALREGSEQKAQMAAQKQKLANGAAQRIVKEEAAKSE